MKNNSYVNLIIYILIGLILVVGIILIIPDNEKLPTNNEVIEEVVFTTVDKEITLDIGDTKEINYTLSGDYVINWFSSNTSVATINNGVVTGVNSGTCNITGSINVNGKMKLISVKIIVNGKEEPPDDTIKIEKLIIESNKVSVTEGETKEIKYRIEPENGEIKTLRWESEDSSIASINEGVVTGIKEGTTHITLNINEIFIGKIEINVKPKITGLELTTSPNLTLKVGDTSQIGIQTIPSNAKVKIEYQSNNSNVTVSDTGLIKAINSGNSIVTVKAYNFTKTINVTVRPKTGVVDGTGIWAYNDDKVITPTRARSPFFANLVNNGVGSLNGNIYTYSKYTYDIEKSNLTVDGRTSMVRIYYPNGYDLSSVNTFTFIGGSGERNWGGFFASIDKDPSLIRSGGIIILVSGRSSYYHQDAINATEFVKAIVKQKEGMRNSVAGYSLGGPAAAKAAYTNNYDSLFVVNTYIDASDTEYLRDKEIYIYSPNGDSMYKNTKMTLLRIHRDGNYKNVTVITNNSEIINNYQNSMLIVNPGSLQGYGHGWNNIVNSRMFAFACK